MTATTSPKQVTVENFTRAETDHYFREYATGHGRQLGKFMFRRDVSPVDDQTIVRQNRDRLYAAVFDLEAGSVTITLPNPGPRFMSMQSWNQDQHTPGVHYKGGVYKLTREEVGTRYVLVALRMLVNVQKGRDLQDSIKVEQPGGPGTFEVPDWDPASHKRVRDAVMVLAETISDSERMFGMPNEVDPIRFLCGTASLWGGNRREDAIYVNVVPQANDGKTIYKLVVGEVPVDGFWSITLYNKDGYMVPNPLNAYSLNNLTVQRNSEGLAEIQFGGCDGRVPNCLPIMPGWNYTVRLYRPRTEILNGSWKLPDAVPLAIGLQTKAA